MAFPSGEAQHLFYEVLLTNFSQSPVQLHRIDVIDGDKPSGTLIAGFPATALASLVRTVSRDDGAVLAPIPAGGTQIVFLEVVIPEREAIPRVRTH